MSKEIKFGKVARKALKKGVDKMADTVVSTLGAKGQTVIIANTHGAPQVTKDGVTVAREIELPDPVENMGAAMIIEAASNAVNACGDGTTTTALLAQAIVEEGVRVLDRPWYMLGRHINPMDLKRGVDMGVSEVVNYLELISEKVSNDNKRIQQIATISANNDSEIGDLIASAMGKVSSDGTITIGESKGTKTFVDVVDGVQFYNGWLSPYFVTNADKMLTEFDDPLIFLYSKKVANTKEILPVIELGLATGRPLLLIADDYEEEVIYTLSQNRVKKGFQIAAIKSPAYGDKRKNSMEDLALVTGGTLVTEEKGLKVADFVSEMFGSSKRVIISSENTIIVEGGGEQELIKERIEQLKGQAEDALQEWDENEIKDRISKLSGGVAVIYVGGNTDVELKERKDRFEDALQATKAAVEEGILAGGGVALVDATKVLTSLGNKTTNIDQRVGIKILREAIQAPMIQIANNAGKNGKAIWRKSTSLGYPMGYDAKNDGFVNMLDAGIIDPKKVTRIALESAASVATLLLTSAATISPIKE